MLVVSVDAKLYLYNIPNACPTAGPGRETTHMVDAIPKGTYQPGRIPKDNSWIWNQFCGHHEGHRSIAGLTPKGQSVLTILPEIGCSEATFVRRVIRQCDMGPRYATFSIEHDLPSLTEV